MITNSRIADLIRENKPEEITDAIAEGEFFQMQTFQKALIDKVLDGDVDREVAANASSNRHDFMVALEFAEKAQDVGIDHNALLRRACDEPEPERRRSPSPSCCSASRRWATDDAPAAGRARRAGRDRRGVRGHVRVVRRPTVRRERSLPSAETPNVRPCSSRSCSSRPRSRSSSTFEELLPVWQAPAQAYGVPWSVLAAINKIESNFGQNMGPSSAGAIGWMQFMPDTWARWGFDANGDGVADPWNAEDAIYSAARYLAATGGATDIAARCSRTTTHSGTSTRCFSSRSSTRAAARLRRTRSTAPSSSSTRPRRPSLDANAKLARRAGRACRPAGEASTLLAAAQSDQALQRKARRAKAATLADFRVQAAQADVDARQVELQTHRTHSRPRATRRSSTAFAAAQASCSAPRRYSDGYVFPVGGGPGLVTSGTPTTTIRRPTSRRPKARSCMPSRTAR